MGEVELDVVLGLDEQGCLSFTEIGGHTKTRKRRAGTANEMRVVCGGAALTVCHVGLKGKRPAGWGLGVDCYNLASVCSEEWSC